VTCKIEMTTPVFRFAPSPNGFLHTGHAYSVLLNARMAQEKRGILLLRLEDIDTARCSEDYENAIFEDMAWLGINFEPSIRRQSDHFSYYMQALEKLKAKGLAYPSTASRKDIIEETKRYEEQTSQSWPRDPDGARIYPFKRDDPRFTDGRKQTAWRLDMQKALALVGPLTWLEKGKSVKTEPERWGDVVLARKDTPTSYHLSCVVDDALQGVTDIVRGKDLYLATSVHRLLQTLLGLPEPSYYHHDLILDEKGEKLSKSNDSTSLKSLRENGMTKENLLQKLGLSDIEYHQPHRDRQNRQNG
jgi:glutamyl-Q tRNA(Asp) synthetase